MQFGDQKRSSYVHGKRINGDFTIKNRSIVPRDLTLSLIVFFNRIKNRSCTFFSKLLQDKPSIMTRRTKIIEALLIFLKKNHQPNPELTSGLCNLLSPSPLAWHKKDSWRCQTEKRNPSIINSSTHQSFSCGGRVVELTKSTPVPIEYVILFTFNNGQLNNFTTTRSSSTNIEVFTNITSPPSGPSLFKQHGHWPSQDIA